jgi:hypothetical protein
MHAQGRTGPYFQDFNEGLIEDLLARYPNLVRAILYLVWVSMPGCASVQEGTGGA